MNTKQIKRLASGLAAASLLTVAMAVPATAAPPAGSSRNIVVTGVLTYTISAGESVPYTITVTNAGKQTINNVNLLFGEDDNRLAASNGDATPPTAFPTGVTVSTTTPGCTGGATLTCAIGTLAAKQSATINAAVATTSAAVAREYLTEAVVSVAEGGGDAGSNIDTFSSQGSITLVPFSCNSTTAYRPVNASKEVATCDVGVNNPQSAKIKFPARLTTVTLTENPGANCPVITGLTCIGDEVVANVTGDTTGDVIYWELRIQLNGASVTLNKLVVVHTSDEAPFAETQISLAKKNACKSLGSTNCGSASIVDGVLIVTVQTPGNGKTRLLG